MEITKTFDVDYYSHKYSETWELQDGLHCPKCKAPYVFRATSGDFYQGEQHMCGECGTNWCCHGFKDASDPYDTQRLAKLKGGV